MRRDDLELCRLCGDLLKHPDDEVHDECLDEYRRQITARVCYVCAEPLDDAMPDNGIHDQCVEDVWQIPPDPFLTGDP